MKIDEVNIGEKLKEAADNSKLTWKEIASKTNIPEPTLYKLVKSRDIKVMTLLKIAGALNIPMEFFFGVTETDIDNELRQLLEEERSKNHILEKALELSEQQFYLIITLMKEVEKHEIPRELPKFTLVEREESRKISLSHFLLIFERMMSASKVQGKEEMYMKYAGQFINIVEIRRALRENPLLIPGRSVGILSEILENQEMDAYIDLKGIFKKL